MSILKPQSGEPKSILNSVGLIIEKLQSAFFKNFDISHLNSSVFFAESQSVSIEMTSSKGYFVICDDNKVIIRDDVQKIHLYIKQKAREKLNIQEGFSSKILYTVASGQIEIDFENKRMKVYIDDLQSWAKANEVAGKKVYYHDGFKQIQFKIFRELQRVGIKLCITEFISQGEVIYTIENK